MINITIEETCLPGVLTWASCHFLADVAPVPVQYSWQWWLQGSCIQMECVGQGKHQHSHCTDEVINIHPRKIISDNIFLHSQWLLLFCMSTLDNHDSWFWEFTPCAVLCVHSQYLIILTITRWWACAWIEGRNKSVPCGWWFFFYSNNR